MMQGMVPLYGFGGGSGGTGATLTVTAPAGCTVTVSKDGMSKTKAADSSGTAVFKGLETGEWTITITDGEQTAQKTATVTADYTAEITFFAATINVTYPAGFTCTATDGVTTLTAPDTSGTWACVVPNAGTWTLSIGVSYVDNETVSITSSGQSVSAEVNKKYIFKSGKGALVTLTKASQDHASITLTNSTITCAYNSGDNYIQIYIWTSAKINLSNYKTLYLDAAITGIGETGYQGRMGISTTIAYPGKDVTLPAQKYPTADGVRRTYNLSISSINGNYYVGVAGGLKGTIYNIYLGV